MFFLLTYGVAVCYSSSLVVQENYLGQWYQDSRTISQALELNTILLINALLNQQIF